MPLRRPFCPTAVHFSPCYTPRRTATFHTTAIGKNERTNHYETLGLDSNASAGAIKKQFYSLSKTHHPDHNPNDPNASERFVKISEAYATLGNPEKRERYDRDTQSVRGAASPRPTRPGSHSSSSTPFGSRPASGLSRRRTQFKGPPPSFYRNGGWGTHGQKRQTQAEGAKASSVRRAAESTGPGGGLGPGQGQAGWNNDVPHFDREGHYRTQKQQDQRRMRRRQDESVEFGDGGGTFLRFLVTSGVVMLAISIPFLGGAR